MKRRSEDEADIECVRLRCGVMHGGARVGGQVALRKIIREDGKSFMR